MTPDDLVLDSNIFVSSRSIRLFRIAQAEYADLSGVGSAFSPGRWNVQNQEAIYTSTDIATPLLEKLAHIPKNQIPSNLAMMRIRLTGDWQVRQFASAELMVDRGTNGTFWICNNLAIAREMMDSGIISGSLPFALAVPSVIVPAWNVVLYPLAPAFDSHVSLESVEPFLFDPRLFPEDTPVESPR